MRKVTKVHMKIGTLNLNGETWNLNNKTPRLPKPLFNPIKIKEELTRRTTGGLAKILKTKEYDILAVQELVFIQEHHKAIETLIHDSGYKLVEPRKLSSQVHFTVAFIIKENWRDYKYSTVVQEESNRFLALDFNMEKWDFTIVNMHVKSKYYGIAKEIAENNRGKRIIVLGDFNTYTSEQIEDGGKISNHADFINEVRNIYTYCGDDKNYTYYTNGIWRKLDHIFVSNEMKNNLTSYNCLVRDDDKKEKDDDVNFYVNENFGFTDHSMLVLNLNFKQFSPQNLSN